MTDQQLQMYNSLTTLQQNVAIMRINMPLSSDVEVYKLGGGGAKTESSTTSAAHRLLNNVDVVSFIDTFIVPVIDDAVMSRNEMIKNLTFVASSNINDVIDWEKMVDNSIVKVRSMVELTTDQRKLIKNVKQTKYGIDVTLHDPMQAMKQLADLQGFNKPQQVELTTPKTLSDFYNDV